MKKCAVGVVLTCEHASPKAGDGFAYLFHHEPEILKTHRGYDKGALELAQDLGETLHVKPVYGQVSRLLVDLNRSLSNRNLFSRFSRSLSEEEKEKILAIYYYPFRQVAAQQIQAALKKAKRVVHLSVHSFTPVLDGKIRACEIGILTDPSRKSDTNLADLWTSELQQKCPQWKVRRNFPYRGVSDGHVTALRKQYPDGCYTGLELEVSHAMMGNAVVWKKTRQVLCTSFAEAVALM